MAEITLRGRDGKVRERLPMVCMCCGEDADLKKEHTFSWSPPWAFLVGGVIAMMIMARRMKIMMPLCEKHKNPWLYSHIAMGVLIAVLVLGFGSMGMMAAMLPQRQHATVLPVAMIFIAAAFIGSLVFLVVVQSQAIRPTEIDPHRMRLTKVSQEFVDAFLDDEDDEDDEEDDDPPPRKPGSKSKKPPRDEEEDDDEPPRTSIKRNGRR